MEGTKCIPYAEWAELTAAVQAKGLACRELELLQEVYPQAAGSAYDAMIYNQLGRLEQYMLRESFRLFQRAAERCLEETDPEILESAIAKLCGHIHKCLFFLRIPEYPEAVKKDMLREIERIVNDYLASFMKYVKELEYLDNSAFIQDLAYLCRKKIRKIKMLQGV